MPPMVALTPDIRSSALVPVSILTRVWGTPTLGEAVPVLILRCGVKAIMHLAPNTCTLSKGGWRSAIATRECVPRLKDASPRGCRIGTSNLGLFIERDVVYSITP